MMLTQIVLVLCLMFGLSVAVADLNEGLVGYWGLDEGKGKEIQEGTGKEHAGTFVAGEPKWTDGQFGKFAKGTLNRGLGSKRETCFWTDAIRAVAKNWGVSARCMNHD